MHEAAFPPLITGEWEGKSSLEWLRLHSLQLLQLLPPISATVSFLYRWPSDMFTRQRLKYWPPDELPHVVTTLFHQQFSKPREHRAPRVPWQIYEGGVNNSFSTWEKVQLEEMESKPNVHFLRSNKFIFTRHAGTLSFCVHVASKQGTGSFGIHAVQAKKKKFHTDW